MKFKLAFAAVALACGMVGVAHARDLVTATLESPLERAEKVVAASLVWSCEGAECTATARSRPVMRDCRELAREIGRISAYGSEAIRLDAEGIAACNERARVRTAAAAPAPVAPPAPPAPVEAAVEAPAAPAAVPVAPAAPEAPPAPAATEASGPTSS